MMSNNRVLLAICCLAIGVCAVAQDSTDGANRTPLGDVARRQKQTQQKKAARVVGDEDMPGAKARQFWGDFATMVTIPYMRISGKLPIDVHPWEVPKPETKVFAWYGPDLNRCFDLGCAQGTYMRSNGTGMKILFESSNTVDDFPEQVLHVEVKNDVRGKMHGVVAIIVTPYSSVAATCLYKDSAPEMQSACDEFADSLELHIPDKFIYVQHTQPY